MIGITGASGALGRATAEAVLQVVDPRQVVLTTRTPKELADLAARGAQVRQADFNDLHYVTPALDGVDRLLLISTDQIGARLHQHLSAIAAAAAAAAGVSHIVYTSLPEPVPANPAVVAADHNGTEQALRESGLRWTMLRNHLYAHLQIPVVEQAAVSGRLVTNSGDGTAAYVTREDCAAVAAAVLTQDGYANQILDVGGPEEISAHDLLVLAQEISGRDVELVAVDDLEFADGLRSAGLPDPVAQLLTSFGAATRDGYLAGVTSTVADLTGRAPTRFADVVRAALAA